MLGGSCNSRPKQVPPLGLAPERVNVEIVLSNGDSTDVVVELDTASHGSRVFMSCLGRPDDFAVAVAYSYVGHFSLANPFRESDVSDGHIIAFRLLKLDTKTLAVQESQLVYGMYNGYDTVVASDYGVRIVIHASDPENSSYREPLGGLQ